MRPTDCGRNLNISPFPPLIRFNKASWYVNHSLYHPRPHSLLFQCLFLSFHSSALLPFIFPLLSHFLAFHLHVLFLFLLHIPISSFIVLVLPCFLSLASWWPLPCDLFAPLATCALWLPLSDVAYHRAQHALNKPSNPKTPQGTIVFALTLSPPLCPPCGCQPPPPVAKTSPASLCPHAIIKLILAALTSECLFKCSMLNVFLSKMQ